MTASTSAWVAVAARSRRMLVMPISAQSLCFALTYQWLPGSSPTSTVPSPGTTPCSARRATRSASSSLIDVRVAEPSRMRAVTRHILPSRPCVASSGRKEAHQLRDVALPREGLGARTEGAAAALPLDRVDQEAVERLRQRRRVARVDVDAIRPQVFGDAA